MVTGLYTTALLSLLLASPWVLAPGAPSPQVEGPFLKGGEAVERELKGGESHSYRLRMEEGQYLRVLVEQKGVDVAVRLTGPGGARLAEADSPSGAQGPEAVSVITESAGDYGLEIRAPDEKAGPGWYHLKVEELRGGTVLDRSRVAADRALAEAEGLRSERKADSLRKAVGKYEEALPHLRALEDRWREAVALHRIGLVYWQMGDSLRALEYFEKALPLRRLVGDRQGEAYTLNSIGLAYDSQGVLQKALEYLNRSLELRRALGDRAGEANTLSNIGASHYALGDIQKSLEYYSQALPIWRGAGDRKGEAATLSNMGVSYWQLGDSAKALEHYEQSLPLRRATNDRAGESATLQNVGLLHWSQGDPAKALAHYAESLAIAREIGDRRAEAAVIHNMGAAYRSLRDFGKALELYGQALALRVAAADRWGEALTLSHIGTAHVLMGKSALALGPLREALSLQSAMGDRVGEAGTLLNLARAERAGGRLAEARAHVEAALDIVEGTRSQFLDSRLRTLFSASRLDYYDFHVDLLMQMHKEEPSGGYDAQALGASERARARGLLEMLAESGADIRRGADPDLLSREHLLRQRLGVKSERLAFLLAAPHTEAQERAAAKEVDDLLEEYRALEGQIRVRSPRYASLTQPRPPSVAEIQKELDEGTLLLEYTLGEERSYLWAVTRSSVQSFELPRRSEVEEQARRAYDAMTARNKVVGFEEPHEREARVDASDALFIRAGGALSETLLAPAALLSKARRLLIVGDGVLQYLPFAALPLPSPSGGLARKVNYTPLIKRYEVVSLPSASILVQLRNELNGRRPAPLTVAVLADPVFDINDERLRRPVSSAAASPRRARGEVPRGSGATADSPLTRSVRDVSREGEGPLLPLPRLPFTRREADAIAALSPPGGYEKALDFDASREAALDPGLSRYRYVHFATHAILNARRPELSGVVLSLVDRGGRSQQGFLLAHEVYNLRLPAELVVLSGCRTGLGQEVRGEGLLGLTRGFMYAGAARVAVSLWDVNDRSTAELMARLYEGMLRRRLSPAAALRRAQLEMWSSAQWGAPYYWAAFSLQGEYR